MYHNKSLSRVSVDLSTRRSGRWVPSEEGPRSVWVRRRGEPTEDLVTGQSPERSHVE